MSYTFAWVLALAALLLLAARLGHLITGYWTGALIDSRGRYSLTHFQLVLWTVLVLATLLGLYFAGPGIGTIPDELLMLIGVSAGSALISTGVKGYKDDSPTANIARAKRIAPPKSEGAGPEKAGAPGAASPRLSPRAVRETWSPRPRLVQIFLEEEGDLADQVMSVSKFQNFVLTLVLAVIYVSAVFAGEPAWPTFDGSAVWLLGISHATYVGSKVPDRK